MEGHRQAAHLLLRGHRRHREQRRARDDKACGCHPGPVPRGKPVLRRGRPSGASQLSSETAQAICTACIGHLLRHSRQDTRHCRPTCKPWPHGGRFNCPAPAEAESRDQGAYQGEHCAWSVISFSVYAASPTILCPPQPRDISCYNGFRLRVPSTRTVSHLCRGSATSMYGHLESPGLDHGPLSYDQAPDTGLRKPCLPLSGTSSGGSH